MSVDFSRERFEKVLEDSSRWWAQKLKYSGLVRRLRIGGNKLQVPAVHIAANATGALGRPDSDKKLRR